MKKVVIFPHAGGASLFYSAIIKEPVRILPIYLDYPGHLLKLTETLAETMDELVDYLLEELLEINDLVLEELIFFGHSMGGSVAYEVAKRIYEKYNISIEKLIISAKLPPGEMNLKIKIETIEDMWEYIQSLHKQPDEIHTNQELGKLLFPIMQQDISLLKQYETELRYPKYPLGNIQPHIFIGAQDKGDLKQYQNWQKFFQEKCQYEFFNGGHFYLQEDKNSFLKILHKTILET
ncbi:thioesterase II family protein [Lysinibacillus sp. NPDC093692]|uniref:thioesterase II family protein n=1 Tax=Lysinibacillus sp. NPDC093692 TaxID=3390578 RepID=UPI003CFDE279